MVNKTIWVIITVIIALVMLFNRKARVTQILAAQLRVFILMINIYSYEILICFFYISHHTCGMFQRRFSYGKR